MNLRVVISHSKTYALLLVAALNLPAWADGLGSLEAFLKSVHSGTANFSQVVTAPVREGQPVRSKTSTGTFAFVRPNRFRFDYSKPFAQTIVADGKTLWLYDPNLNQVTQRDQSQTLSTTPAALIATASDVQSLQKDFLLADAPDKDGLQWVNGAPKAKDSQILGIRVGFNGDQLAALEILDAFGQKSVLHFSKLQANAAIAPEQFKFQPPAGADVLRQ